MYETVRSENNRYELTHKIYISSVGCIINKVRSSIYILSFFHTGSGAVRHRTASHPAMLGAVPYSAAP